MCARPTGRDLTSSGERPGRRGTVAAVGLAVGVLAATVASVSGWLWWRVDRPAGAARAVAAALARPPVQDRIAELLAADLQRRAPAADPAELRVVLTGLARAPELRSVLQTAVAVLQSSARSGATARLDRAEQVYALALDVVRAERPALAGRLPETGALGSFHLAPGGAVGTALRDVHRLGQVAVPSAVLAVVAGAVGVTMTPRRRRRTTVTMGLAAVGTLTAAVALAGPYVASRRLPGADRPAARAVVDVLTAPLARLAAGVVVAALVVAVAGRIVPAVWGRRRLATWIGVGAASAAILAVAGRDVSDHHGDAGRCLGSAALCDRPFDRVVLAGTHNAMNSSRAGFLLPEQRLDIGEQLDRGIRALLIDTHYGRRAPDGLVWTDIEVDGPDRARLVERYGADLVDRVTRLRDASTPPAGPRALYLCHNLCELGATDYGTMLGRLRHWLLAHPGEIVVLFVQDESGPDDNIAAVRGAGLEPLTFAHRDADPWPTLRELIRTDRRLFVLAEHRGGGTPWYQPGFPLYRDTSFDVPRADAFTCAVNRGTAASPLFLLNHWVETAPPSPAQAAAVNQPDVIVRRAQQCAASGGRLPNIVAVDFSDEGDVRGAVDRLNASG